MPPRLPAMEWVSSSLSLIPPRSLLDELPIRATLAAMATSTRRAALYVRVSTSDRGQTVENQLQPLQEAAGRLGWTVVAIYRDEGISGSRGAISGLGWMSNSRQKDRRSRAGTGSPAGDNRRSDAWIGAAPTELRFNHDQRRQAKPDAAVCVATPGSPSPLSGFLASADRNIRADQERT